MKAKCPNCGAVINPAALLGKLAAGKRKPFSKAERARRAKRLAEARERRWK